ncbi:hypothetical protein D3C86_1960360 [compost metagenome]
MIDFFIISKVLVKIKLANTMVKTVPKDSVNDQMASGIVRFNHWFIAIVVDN